MGRANAEKEDQNYRTGQQLPDALPLRNRHVSRVSWTRPGSPLNEVVAQAVIVR